MTAPLLPAINHSPATAAPDALTVQRECTCLECGRKFKPRGERLGTFCRPQCVARHANRRKTRGAVLYDIFMESRFNRAVRTNDDRSLISVMNGLASQWRQEDHESRHGRRSWVRYRDVIARHPWINSVVTRVRAGR